MTLKRLIIIVALFLLAALTIYLHLPNVYKVGASSYGLGVAVVYPDGTCQRLPPRLPLFYRTTEISSPAYIPLDCYPASQRKYAILTRQLLTGTAPWPWNRSTP